jgi:hypothetical protein
VIRAWENKSQRQLGCRQGLGSLNGKTVFADVEHESRDRAYISESEVHHGFRLQSRGTTAIGSHESAPCAQGTQELIPDQRLVKDEICARLKSAAHIGQAVDHGENYGAPVRWGQTSHARYLRATRQIKIHHQCRVLAQGQKLHGFRLGGADFFVDLEFI